MEITTKKPLDVIQRYLLLGAIVQAVTAQLEPAETAAVPMSPYQGNDGQRPDERWRRYVQAEHATPPSQWIRRMVKSV